MIEQVLRRAFAAEKGFIGPHIRPVPIAAAISDSKLVKIGVDYRQGDGPVVIKDHIS